MNNFEKPAKIDWSLHTTINQPYRTHSLLQEQNDLMPIINTYDVFEEEINEFPDAIKMLSAIGVNTNGK